MGPANNQPVPIVGFLRSSADGGKRIDARYLRNSKEVRLQLLAGLIDTDGHLIDGCYEIATKWEGLRDDILFLCRSLGLSVTHAIKRVNDVEYYRIYVSGDNHSIPCITRKKAAPRRQIKDALVYGFSVDTIGFGEYFGFAIDGNHLYLLADFTVTHNTLQQIEILRIICSKIGGRALIVAPLGVRAEFIKDGAMVGVEIKFVRSVEECGETGIYITNYETVREGKIDPTQFVATSLDEASILRGFGGTKTFREFMRLFEGVRFRFVATATPDPNEYIELLAYAGYLGVMEIGEAKTRFFKRDSTKADVLTLLENKEHEFWMWLSSWALFIQKPSDVCECSCHKKESI
jgi:hypothetical protein